MMKWKKRIVIICVGIVLSICIAVMIYFSNIESKKFHYEGTEAILYNPYIGFAPNADYIEAVGENTLVFVEVTFREWEPEEGVYAWQQIEEENNLELWRQQGKHVVFRFLCDDPDEESHLDIPDWLYEQTKDGEYYDTDYGKGYAPNYENELFIKKHQEAIEALGTYFGQDDFFYYIELGSLGHWGEWHVKSEHNLPPMPGEEVCKQYVEPYERAFPNAYILLRRPYTLGANRFGIFNDMTGSTEDTQEWLDWIEQGGEDDEARTPLSYTANPTIWNQYPVGGEFTSSISMENMLTDKLQNTVLLLKQSHMSFIGPMCPIANEELMMYPREVAEVSKQIGYRFGVEACEMTYNHINHKLNIRLNVVNRGVAPMYADWPMYLYLCDQNTMQVIMRKQLPISVAKLYGGNSQELVVEIPIDNRFVQEDKLISLEEMQVAVGIENPNTMYPEIALDMNTKNVEKMYCLIP